MLFVNVPKVEIEICHRGLTGVAYGFNILYYCRTEMSNEISTLNGENKGTTNQRMVLPEPATQMNSYQTVSGRE